MRDPASHTYAQAPHARLRSRLKRTTPSPAPSQKRGEEQRGQRPIVPRVQRRHRSARSKAGRHDPKTAMKVAISRNVPVAVGATHDDRFEVERAAPQHAIFVDPVPVFTPLPHVSSHVQQTIRAGPPGIAINRRGVPNLILIVAARVIGLVIAHGYVRPSVPRAAFSHCCSVGSRTPDHVQKATASCQLTYTTGWFSLPDGLLPFRQCSGGAWPVASTNAPYC